MRGLSYILRHRLYLSLTNVTNSVSPLSFRGPSFRLPEDCGFAFLPDDFVPTAEDIFDVVDEAFHCGMVRVGDMGSDDITFAGAGEPLLQLHTLTRAAYLIKLRRHGAVLRVKTNGLVAASDASDVANLLKEAGIAKVSIALMSDNPEQYHEIMQPAFTARADIEHVDDYFDIPEGGDFMDVCSMVVSCAEAGLDVECTAVERPDVNIPSVRALALSLGAIDFTSMPYYS